MICLLSSRDVFPKLSLACDNRSRFYNLIVVLHDILVLYKTLDVSFSTDLYVHSIGGAQGPCRVSCGLTPPQSWDSNSEFELENRTLACHRLAALATHHPRAASKQSYLTLLSHFLSSSNSSLLPWSFWSPNDHINVSIIVPHTMKPLHARYFVVVMAFFD